VKLTFILTAILGLLACGHATAQTNQSIIQTPAKPPVLRSAGAQRTSASGDRNGTAEADLEDVIRVSTNLITVPAAVMDRNGRYIANLRRDDFKIFEDGVEQDVAYFASIEKPFTVLLMLDVSGSTQTQLTQIREAANTLVGRLRSNDRLMAIAFDGRINVLNEQPMTVSAIRRTKLHIPQVTDGTVLYDAVEFGLKRLAPIAGRKAIILFTDGVDQNSHTTMKDNLADVVEQDVMIYTVRYNTLPQLPQRLSVIQNEKARRRIEKNLMQKYAVSESYLKALADKTGGRYYRADDLADVAPAFEAITEELGVQYSLGYYPKANSRATADRSIKVRVRYPNMVVRARDNYSPGKTVARLGND
jgi:Ca-activated chloride channel homolog